MSQLDYTVNRRVGTIQTARLIARRMQLNATTIAPALQIARMVALIAKGRVSFYSLAQFNLIFILFKNEPKVTTATLVKRKATLTIWPALQMLRLST